MHDRGKERVRGANGEIPQIVSGSRVRLTADWGKLRAGEELEICRLDGPGLIVFPVIGKKEKEEEEEFWIPASLVPNSSISRAWSFRPRRIDSQGESVRLPQDMHAEENGPPAILTIPCSIRATAGGVARLVLEARRVDRAIVTWRKEGQRCDVVGGDRYRLYRTADSLSLEIAPCLPSDSGIYHCRVEHETGSCSAKIPLCVVGPSPNAWNDKIEMMNLNESSMVVALSNSKIKTILRDTQVASREAKEFSQRYVELKELGAGRFAQVYRARDTESGRQVALKQICRLKQSRSLTRAEYDLLETIRHENIVRAFGLFEDAPQPDTDTIIMELVNGSTLFAHLGKQNEYTEATVSMYTGQLLSALEWLHSRKRAHLDLKPENVLIDRETDAVKLIDLGEAVRAAAPLDQVVPPADLEFAAPESVLGKPTGSYTDIWAAGVFIYVLLSGLSPFLDDSVEETTTNILKCDFCFPDEYFGNISSDAKGLLRKLLCLRGEERATARASLSSPWFEIPIGATIPSSRMLAFIDRRAHRSKGSRQDRNSSFYP